MRVKTFAGLFVQSKICSHLQCIYAYVRSPFSPEVQTLSICSWNIIFHTGCFVETVKNYLLIARARKQLISWDRCPFVHQICTFWYLVSNIFPNYSVIIHLWRLYRCIIWKIWKMHWKSQIENQRYFANISATNARIFLKYQS